MDFKNIPSKYRPIPFWSWNDSAGSYVWKENWDENKCFVEYGF